jgi:hypothetical protein
MIHENQRLTSDEIMEYSKEYDLDPSGKKCYIYKFLFNDRWNNAQDPRPFRVKPSLIEKLAKDSIGMPYVVNPKNTQRHLRGKNNPDSAKELLEIQAEYSIGVIRVPVIKPSNNVYGIIEVWPEYEDEIENLPVFTSSTLAPIKEDADGIDDAIFINLNAVDTPGYPEMLSKMHGVCKNGIKECVAELSVLGAAGSLKTSRNNPQIFLNNLNSLKLNMSSTEGSTPPAEPTLAEIASKIDGVQVTADKVVKNVENNNVVLKEVATVTEGVDETKVIEKIDGTSAPADPPADPPIVGASGAKSQTLTIPKELKNNPFVQELTGKLKEYEKDLQAIKNEAQSRKEQEKLAMRTAQATSIVTKQILLKQVKAEDKDKEIKKYVELKNEDGEFENLAILDNYLKSAIPSEDPEVVGASGYSFPGIGSDKTPETVSNAEAMGFES